MKATPGDELVQAAAPDAELSGGELGIPDFALIRRIGRGSYGQVWLARSATGSYRAVKVVFRDAFDSESPYEREFAGIQEFEPISRAHSGQLDILHVGRNDEEGFFYYVMELADDAAGGKAEQEDESATTDTARSGTGTRRAVDPQRYEPDTLQRRLKEHGRLGAWECLDIAVELAEALSHLHANGLVHRDIKPSNIIFVRGRPKLADIGLVAHAEEELSVVGTEGFMPPEGPGQSPADLYALGKVFYEMATGHDRRDFPLLPKPADDPHEQRAFVEFNEVVLRCCERAVENRYASAVDVLTDLNLLRQGRSIRRLRMVERRLAMMRKASLAGVAAVAVIVAGYLYQRGVAQEQQEQRERAETAAAEATAAVWLRESHEIERLLETGETGQALSLLVQRSRDERNNRDAAGRLMSVLSYRDFPLPVAELSHEDEIVGADVSPDGRLLATATEPGEVRIWDLDTGILVAEERAGDFGLEELGGFFDKVRWNVQFSPDGMRLLAPGGDDRAARIWRIPEEGKPELELEIGPRKGAGFMHAEFSPDGSRVVTVARSGDAYVWDAHNGEQLAMMEGGKLISPEPGRRVWVLGRFSSDGEVVITSMSERNKIGHFSAWDSETGAHLRRHDELTFVARGRPDFWHAPLALQPDGPRVVWRRHSGQPTHLRAWNYRTGDVESPAQGHEWPIHAVAFSPSGRLIATGSNDQTVRLWEVGDGLELRQTLRPKGFVHAVAFRPDGELLAVALRDGTVQRWDLATGERVGEPLRHAGRIRHVLFSPDGQRLICFENRSAWIWDIRPGEARPTLLVHDAGGDVPGYVKALRFSPDGKRLVTSLGPNAQGGGYGTGMRRDGAIDPQLYSQVWDAATGKPVAAAPVMKSSRQTKQTAVISADGSLALTPAENGAVWWDPRTGEEIGRLEEEGVFPKVFALSPDGRWALLSNAQDNAAVWDLRNSKQQLELHDEGAIVAAGFSPDSRRVLTVSEDGMAKIRRMSDGEVEVRLQDLDLVWPHGWHKGLVEWSPDGTLVAIAHGPHGALYRTDSGRQVREWSVHHTSNVRAMRFSAEGRSLLTASSDHTAKLWDVIEGRQAVPELRHDWVVAAAAFDERAERVATASWDKSARVWDRHTGLPLTASLPHPDWVLAVAFDPAGRWLATGGRDGVARMWELPEASGTTPTWLIALAEYLGGFRGTRGRSRESVADPGRLIALRGQLAAAATENDDDYARWAQWFFADRASRPTSPSSGMTMADYRSRLESVDTLVGGATHELLRELAPMDGRYLARAGHKLVARRDADEAADVERAGWLTRLAVERAPDLAMAWWARAELLLAVERIEEASAAVDRALELDPEDANAWLVQALVLEASGVRAEAKEAFQRSVERAEGWLAQDAAQRKYLDPLLRVIAGTDRASPEPRQQLLDYLRAPERGPRIRRGGEWLAE